MAGIKMDKKSLMEFAKEQGIEKPFDEMSLLEKTGLRTAKMFKEMLGK